MIVLKENQRLYLHSCNYNMARMMSALANLVKEHGGRVMLLYVRNKVIQNSN